MGEQFTEMFLKRHENVTLILSFLEEYDFKVRWPALKLLAVLLANRCVSWYNNCVSRSAALFLVWEVCEFEKLQSRKPPIFRLKDIQEIILVSPMGVSKLMDLLGDSREVIRNDVSY